MSDRRATTDQHGSKIITSEKLQTFLTGSRRKTAFERQREEQEERKKRQDEEAAKVYADFVASFDDPVEDEMVFVRGGTMNPSEKDAVENIDICENESANSKKGRIFRARVQPYETSDRPEHAAYQREEPTTTNPSKRRKIDELVSNLLRNQQNKVEEYYEDIPVRINPPLPPLPRETTLPYSAISTNVYVGNLNHKINEEVLCRDFGKFGPIASVKIMWPRAPDEMSRDRNSGFVCFMDRPSALRAMHEMQNKEHYGHCLRLDWGRPLPIPAKPIYIDDSVLSRSSCISYPGIIPGEYINIIKEQSIKQDNVILNEIHLPSNKTGTNLKDSETERDLDREDILECSPKSEISIIIPEDPKTLLLIHETVERVLNHGHNTEEKIKNQNIGNPSYGFLNETDIPLNHYYRWKLNSLLQGDTFSEWQTTPFRMQSGGPYFRPPKCNSLNYNPTNQQSRALSSKKAGLDVMLEAEIPSSDDDLEGEHYSRKLLVPVLQRIRGLCARLGPDRRTVARAMAFFIDSAEAVAEASAELERALLKTPTTNERMQLYLLHLTSDILSNCTAPVQNAWRYRDTLQSSLPKMLRHMGDTYRKLRSEGRWKADGWRTEVLAVLGTWRRQMLYPRDYLDDLEVLFKPATEVDESTVLPIQSVEASIVTPETNTTKVVPKIISTVVENTPRVTTIRKLVTQITSFNAQHFPQPSFKTLPQIQSKSVETLLSKPQEKNQEILPTHCSQKRSTTEKSLYQKEISKNIKEVDDTEEMDMFA